MNWLQFRMYIDFFFREASEVEDLNREKVSGSESESESSQRSSTGKDFEMVDQEELDT